MQYSALIIDIINSRKYTIEDRQTFQELLKKYCACLNEVFSDNIEKVVDFSAGDELQGLFDNPGTAFLYYRFLSILLPQKTRAGIGIGNWDIKIEDGGSSAQDGPAYHRAREAITLAKENKVKSVVLISGNVSFDQIANELICSSISEISNANEKVKHVMKLVQGISPIIEDESRLDKYRRLFIHNTDEFWNGEEYVCSLPVNITDCTRHLITEGNIRGLQMAIANVAGISKQSVQKTMKTNQIFKERNAAIGTYRYLMSWRN